MDAPLRYAMWGIALVLDLSLPPLSPRMVRPRVPTSGSHLPERWALFTMIVIGESVVAVALATSGTDWRLDSAAAAVLGFAAIVGTWWLYFDRQASVVLRSSTRIAVIYSYAHLPLLMGLAATSAGLRLLIERAGEDQRGAGPSFAFIGGIVLFLISLVATRSVTVSGPRRLGISLKLGTAALLGVLLLAQSVLPPVALAGGAAFVLAALVFTERMLFPPSQPTS